VLFFRATLARATMLTGDNCPTERAGLIQTPVNIAFSAFGRLRERRRPRQAPRDQRLGFSSVLSKYTSPGISSFRVRCGSLSSGRASRGRGGIAPE